MYVCVHVCVDDLHLCPNHVGLSAPELCNERTESFFEPPSRDPCKVWSTTHPPRGVSFLACFGLKRREEKEKKREERGKEEKIGREEERRIVQKLPRVIRVITNSGGQKNWGSKFRAIMRFLDLNSGVYPSFIPRFGGSKIGQTPGFWKNNRINSRNLPPKFFYFSSWSRNLDHEFWALELGPNEGGKFFGAKIFPLTWTCPDDGSFGAMHLTTARPSQI